MTRLEHGMKLIFRNARRVIPFVCVALWLIGAIGLPCATQATESKSSGTAVPAPTITQSPLPAPAGLYEVGRTEFDWVDTSRPDPDSPSGHREMFDHPHPGEGNYHRDAVVFRGAKPAYRLTLAGSEHGFSGDGGFLPFLPASAKKADSGTIDPARALTITIAYAEAFFLEYLAGKKSPLLNGPSPEYPEITFETNKKTN